MYGKGKSQFEPIRSRPIRILENDPPDPSTDRQTDRIFNFLVQSFLMKAGTQNDVMEVVILEKINSANEAYGKEREKMYITTFNTDYRGL